MPICGHSSEDREYAHELHLQDIEDRQDHLLKCRDDIEGLISDADNYGDADEYDFWNDIFNNLDTAADEIGRIHDDHLNAGDWAAVELPRIAELLETARLNGRAA